MMTENTFQPDWISAPGETMTDILEERDLSLAEFAKQMGHPHKHIHDLLHGKAMITIETARKLEVVLGGSAAFWMIRDSQYRKDYARIQSDENLSENTDWLKELPLKDMIKLGWIKSIPHTPDQIAECLHFFDVPNVRAWRDTYRNMVSMATFRTSPSFNSQLGSVAAWLRQAEIQATSIDCKRWDANRFQETLSSIKLLTRKKDPSLFIPELEKRCAECGVAVVIVRAPAGCQASGATRFLSPNKALLALSFRYLSDDHFWFTFFHEAGHLLLHGKKALFLEGNKTASTIEEKEANEFSASVLIPHEFQPELLKLPVDSHEIIRFAKRVGVSPGIVVGQAQHIGRLNQNQLNSLKRRFCWSSD